MTRARRWRLSLVVAAVVLWLLVGGGAPAKAWAAGGAADADVVVVQVPRLGPMLLPGRDAGSAARAYVDGLLRRDVFPSANAAELRAWAAGVAAAPDRAPTLDALRATGRPVIGVQLGKATDVAGGADAWIAHRAEIATAIVEGGGVPLFLPPGGDAHAVGRLVRAIDGLVLVGGQDVSTELQPGVRPDPRFDTNVKQDRYEQAVIHRALAAGLHVHAICRGSQLLQVTFGGRLVQDLPTSGLAGFDHGSGQTSGEKQRHAIRFTADSVIGRALGDRGQRLAVEGIHFHHQAVDAAHVAPGFRVVAWSNDGVAEAIEGLGGRVVGVQVHPESAGKGTALRRAFFGSTMMEPARAIAAARAPATATPFKSERAVTLALHAAVGKGTTRATWTGWRAPPPAIASAPRPAR